MAIRHVFHEPCGCIATYDGRLTLTFCPLHAAAGAMQAALARYETRSAMCHCDRTMHPSGICASCAVRNALALTRGEAS